MKEKIYTIPVTDAFKEDCECSLCLLEKRFENDNIEYFLGPSLMEPDCRMETNEHGFCKSHFEMLFNSKKNTLGLGLVLETHIDLENQKLKKMTTENESVLIKEATAPFIKNLAGKLTSKQSGTEKHINELIAELSRLENDCTLCRKLNYTMDRYIDVILYLWFKENEFRNLFNSKKGFCVKHLKLLLEGTLKHLDNREAALFTSNLMELQLKHMVRIQEEVSWFTKKFDYRNNDAPWGNSKDAIQRSIQKLVGYSDLK